MLANEAYTKKTSAPKIAVWTNFGRHPGSSDPKYRWPSRHKPFPSSLRVRGAGANRSRSAAISVFAYVLVTGDRRFESISLQRGVGNEPGRRRSPLDQPRIGFRWGKRLSPSLP